MADANKIIKGKASPFSRPLSQGSRGDSSQSKHKVPSPIPLFLETVTDLSHSQKKKSFEEVIGAELERQQSAGHERIDKLLQKASKVLDGSKRVRAKKLEESLEVQRKRAERRRQYDIDKDNPPLPQWVIDAEKHKGERPLKTLDEWLGYLGPKLRSSARELERQPTIDSFLPRMQENHSQYDSETRANLMARNSEKLRYVEEKLNTIAKKVKRGEALGGQSDDTSSYSADEVLAKLTPDALEAVQKHFDSLGGSLNLTEFVEIMQAHLPKEAWKTSESQLNNIMELCAQLDINGDGMVSWEEMYEFTVEMGKTGATTWDKLDDIILSYLPSVVVDHRGEDNRTGYKDGEIERIECLQMMDKIAVLEKDSPVIKLYDASTLELTDCLTGHKGAVLRCIHLEGTDYIVSSGADTALIFWGAFTNNQRQILPSSEVFMSLVWDAPRRILYAGSSTGHVHCFSVPDVVSVSTDIGISAVKVFRPHKDVVTDMLSIPDLGLLVTASMDANILVWDLAQHASRKALKGGHNKGVYSLAYIPSQRYLISAGYDHHCKVWNPMIEEPLFTMHGHSNVIAGLTVVLGSNRVITVDVDAVLKVWDIRNFSCVQTIKMDDLVPGTVSDLTYVSRMDRAIISGKRAGQLSKRVHILCCLDYEHPAQPEVADEEPVACAMYSRVNNTITTASARTVRLWNASTGLLSKSFVNITESIITAMCFDDRERKIILGEESGELSVFNYLNGALMKRLEPHLADVCAVSYCPFSKCILSASWGGRVRVHHDARPDKAKVLRQIDGHSSDVTCMVYSVALSLIATACTGGGVRLWDFEDAKLAGTCQAHTTEVTILAFLDEYRVLLTGDFLGNLILWSVAPWRERMKPIVRWEYLIEGHAQGTKRDTPTSCAFHTRSHTLFVGGSSGHIVSYDTSMVLEELLAWQGLDETGRKPGNLVPPLPARQFVRNPREGRTKVPEPKREGDGLDSIINMSNDLNADIGATLEWGKEGISGQRVAPRLGPDSLPRRDEWTAHDDTVKTIQLIQDTMTEEEIVAYKAVLEQNKSKTDALLQSQRPTSNTKDSRKMSIFSNTSNVSNPTTPKGTTPSVTFLTQQEHAESTFAESERTRSPTSARADSARDPSARADSARDQSARADSAPTSASAREDGSATESAKAEYSRKDRGSARGGMAEDAAKSEKHIQDSPQQGAVSSSSGRPPAIERLMSEGERPSPVNQTALERGLASRAVKFNRNLGKPPAKKKDLAPGEIVCLLTSSHDQKVCLWTIDGEALGSLRQGDRTKAKNWNFPIPAGLLSSRKEKDTQQFLLHVIND